MTYYRDKMSYPSKKTLLLIQIIAGLAGIASGILSISSMTLKTELATVALIAVTVASISGFAVLRFKFPPRNYDDEGAA